MGFHAEWNHRETPPAGPGSYDRPLPGELKFTPRRRTSDGYNRIDFAFWASTISQRGYGVVGSIEECARAGNTDTKYRFGSATRIPYTIRRRDEAPEYRSSIYVRIAAYSPGALIGGVVNPYVINRGDSRMPIALGSLLSRMVAANYGRYGDRTWIPGFSLRISMNGGWFIPSRIRIMPIMTGRSGWRSGGWAV